jgi:hypothetical protein
MLDRTHCKNGHPWTTENIYLADAGRYISEKCRTCRADASVRFRERKKLAASEQ